MKQKSSLSVGATTRVLPCTCPHIFQDKTYGTGKRLHNFAKKKAQGNPAWVCSVCSKYKPFGGEASAAKKEVKGAS